VLRVAHSRELVVRVGHSSEPGAVHRVFGLSGAAPAAVAVSAVELWLMHDVVLRQRAAVTAARLL
jgi:hypothetical protein